MATYSEQVIKSRKSTLYYYKTGNGPNPLLVFHGFGQDHLAFAEWTRQLTEKYTLYLFDLYFHGKSTWVDNRIALDKAEWRNVLTQLMKDNALRDFSVAGFSLGGKFALASIEVLPHSIKGVFLLAPDGITVNFWYSLATCCLLSRTLFKGLIGYQKRFSSLIRIANRLRIADKWLLRFAENHMNTIEKRERVYNTWVVLRHLQFDMNHIAKLIRQNQIPVLIIAGKYDKVIPPSKMNPLVRRLNPVRFHVLDSGHMDLINQATSFL
jgi:pimeloyl-ACP methyl ester carboxylesterase